METEERVATIQERGTYIGTGSLIQAEVGQKETCVQHNFADSREKGKD